MKGIPRFNLLGMTAQAFDDEAVEYRAVKKQIEYGAFPIYEKKALSKKVKLCQVCNKNIIPIGRNKYCDQCKDEVYAKMLRKKPSVITRKAFSMNANIKHYEEKMQSMPQEFFDSARLSEERLWNDEINPFTAECQRIEREVFGITQ